ncbi:hypothetical protein [Deinococcus humi]|uniref:Uncharacterized protein n=1 Tax=Deinococcus humi TaxID=662880 RepID=A0A7W8NEH1_9DEIO|nr:hypothetical protein [Deinococcus humi]MBB5361783.1 hypothetical protein [Deinococcus humi]
MPPTPLTSAHLRGAAASVLISAVFAVIWGLNGSLALAGTWRLLALLLVAGITAALAGVALKLRCEAAHAPAPPGKGPPNPFLTTAYRVSVIAMVLAFPVAARLLTANGLEDAIMAAIAIIVGLHFFGLVPAFRNGAFAGVGGALCVLGVAALFLPVGIRTAVLGLGCAAILWLGVTSPALRSLGQLRRGHTSA